jgi:hypothetical protein
MMVLTIDLKAIVATTHKIEQTSCVAEQSPP